MVRSSSGPTTQFLSMTSREMSRTWLRLRKGNGRSGLSLSGSPLLIASSTLAVVTPFGVSSGSRAKTWRGARARARTKSATARFPPPAGARRADGWWWPAPPGRRTVPAGGWLRARPEVRGERHRKPILGPGIGRPSGRPRTPHPPVRLRRAPHPPVRLRRAPCHKADSLSFQLRGPTSQRSIPVTLPFKPVHRPFVLQAQRALRRRRP